MMPNCWEEISFYRQMESNAKNPFVIYNAFKGQYFSTTLHLSIYAFEDDDRFGFKKNKYYSLIYFVPEVKHAIAVERMIRGQENHTKIMNYLLKFGTESLDDRKEKIDPTTIDEKDRAAGLNAIAQLKAKWKSDSHYPI